MKMFTDEMMIANRMHKMDSRNSERYQQLNEIVIDAGSLLFDLQLKQGQYVTEMLAENGMKDIPVEVIIPYFNGSEFSSLHAESVSYDAENDMVMVAFTDRDEKISWDEIDAVSQNEIMQDIHARMTSDLRFNAMNSGERPAELS